MAAASRGGGGGGGGGSLRWLELPRALAARDGGTWNLLWTWRPPRVAWRELLPWQRVNHFPQSRQLTRKDLLKKHLQRCDARGRAFDLMPLTFVLPKVRAGVRARIRVRVRVRVRVS